MMEAKAYGQGRPNYANRGNKTVCFTALSP